MNDDLLKHLVESLKFAKTHEEYIQLHDLLINTNLRKVFNLVDDKERFIKAIVDKSNYTLADRFLSLIFPKLDTHLMKVFFKELEKEIKIHGRYSSFNGFKHKSFELFKLCFFSKKHSIYSTYPSLDYKRLSKPEKKELKILLDENPRKNPIYLTEIIHNLPIFLKRKYLLEPILKDSRCLKNKKEEGGAIALELMNFLTEKDYEKLSLKHSLEAFAKILPSIDTYTMLDKVLKVNPKSELFYYIRAAILIKDSNKRKANNLTLLQDNLLLSNKYADKIAHLLTNSNSQIREWAATAVNPKQTLEIKIEEKRKELENLEKQLQSS